MDTCTVCGSIITENDSRSETDAGVSHGTPQACIAALAARVAALEEP